MLRRIRGRLTYANVMATVAVFLALGGGAYAVSTAPRNSVKSSSIKNRQVKTADLANGAVTAAKASNVRRIRFTPTGCYYGKSGCSANLATFGHWKLKALCGGGIPDLYLYVVAPASVATNIALMREGASPHVHGFAGDGEVGTGPDFGGFYDALGSIVVANGSERITITFHAFVGSGVNCVVDGTATRA